MRSTLGWTVSHPAGPEAVRGVIFCLHGYHGDHRMAFDQIHVPDVAAVRTLLPAFDR